MQLARRRDLRGSVPAWGLPGHVMDNALVVRRIVYPHGVPNADRNAGRRGGWIREGLEEEWSAGVAVSAWARHHKEVFVAVVRSRPWTPHGLCSLKRLASSVGSECAQAAAALGVQAGPDANRMIVCR